MSNRVLFFALGLCSLCLGGLIYVFLRTNSIISVMVGNLITIKETQIFISQLSICNFLKYYFADFLWTFSLCSFFHSLYLPNIKNSIIIGIATFLFGLIWETAQYLNFVSGTGDVADIILYLTASLIVVLINLKRGNKK